MFLGHHRIDSKIHQRLAKEFDGRSQFAGYLSAVRSGAESVNSRPIIARSFLHYERAFLRRAIISPIAGNISKKEAGNGTVAIENGSNVGVRK